MVCELITHECRCGRHSKSECELLELKPGKLAEYVAAHVELDVTDIEAAEIVKALSLEPSTVMKKIKK